MSNQKQTFGIDVSRWQEIVDWDWVVNNDPVVEFAGIRATISWNYVDPYLERNMREALRVKVARFPYMVMHPNQPAEKQVDHFLATLGDDIGEGQVVDVELYTGIHDVGWKKQQETLGAIVHYMQLKTNRTPIIYSRAHFIDQHVTGKSTWWLRKPPSWYEKFDWWLAQYLLSGEEHTGQPTLPDGVSRNRVFIHQTGTKGRVLGVSGDCDTNRWQFNKEHFDAYVGNVAPPPPPPVPSYCETQVKSELKPMVQTILSTGQDMLAVMENILGK
jgi:GH25 family lysozyme M1 (1,4-beta-N-acetylmuramidase)